MTEVIVENIAKEKTDVKEKMLGVNVIEVTIDQKKFEFPKIAPIKSEIEKAENTENKIDTDLIQLYHQVQNRSPVTNSQTKKNIIIKYEELREKYPNSIIDIGFEFLKNYKIREAERLAILDIQKQVKTMFLSDIEANKEQTLEDFVSQLENIQNPHNQIVCPTLDLSMTTPDLFEAKIQHVIEKEYPRVNVKFAPFDPNYVNWLDLSENIFSKNIWCNLTTISRGYFHLPPPQRSLLASSFLYGIHTASHNYRRFPTKDKNKKVEEKPKDQRTLVLDRDTLCFNKLEMSSDEAYVKTINNLSAEIQKIKEHVKKETFYSEYVSKKKALSGALHDLERRM